MSETRPVQITEGLSVVIPAYNEESSIGGVVGALRRVLEPCEGAWEIIVVDDGSTDGTARAAAAPGVRVLTHEANLGYGASLKIGIRRASFDCIVITDADMTYPVERVLDLVAAMESVDMAVAARTGPRVAIPLLRRPAKWCLRKLAEFLADVEIPDLNSGLRCFRKSDAGEYMHLLPNGFSFTTTITLAYHADSRLVRYIPVDYKKRAGSSKIRPIPDTYNFFLLVLRTVMYFDPMRIFMPPALVASMITLLTFAYELIWTQNLAEKSLIWLMITVLLLAFALLGDLIVRRRS